MRVRSKRTYAALEDGVQVRDGPLRRAQPSRLVGAATHNARVGVDDGVFGDKGHAARAHVLRRVLDEVLHALVPGRKQVRERRLRATKRESGEREKDRSVGASVGGSCGRAGLARTRPILFMNTSQSSM